MIWTRLLEVDGIREDTLMIRQDSFPAKAMISTRVHLCPTAASLSSELGTTRARTPLSYHDKYQTLLVMALEDHGRSAGCTLIISSSPTASGGLGVPLADGSASTTIDPMSLDRLFEDSSSTALVPDRHGKVCY